MSLIKLPFVAGQSRARSKSVDNQETINLYPELEKEDAKNSAVFYGTPGLKLFTTVSNSQGSVYASPPRGFYITGKGRMFAVYQDKLYEILPSGVVLSQGSLNTNVGYVYMVDNGNQMLITDGLHGYGYDLRGNTLTVITSNPGIGSVFPNFPGTVAYRDGYFITHDIGTNMTYASAAYDVFTWPAAHQVAKETDSDNVVAIISTATYLWIFGQRTTELWYSTGQDAIGAPPFARAQELVIAVGCMAPASVQTNGNDVFWLGSNPSGGNVVWMSNSFTPQRITTHAEEYLIGQVSVTTDATAFTYEQEGHFFYCLNFPSGSRSHCYDLSTKAWHRRGYWNPLTGQFETHLALFAGSLSSPVTLCLDRRNGNIYTFDLDTFTDNGAYIHRIRTLSHTHKDMKNLYVYGFEVDTQKGVGIGDGMMSGAHTSTTSTTTTVADSDPVSDNPQMALQWSKDGGITWSKEHWASMGKIGEFKKRVRWPLGMGKSRDWSFRLSSMAAVRQVWIAAYADIEAEDA